MLREDQVAGVGERGLGVDEGRQRIDVGPHHLGGVLALLERLGEHDGDRLADEADLAVGERRSGEVGVHGGEAVVWRHAEVGGREDLDHAGHRACIVEVDGADGAVGDVGAHEHGVQLVRQVEIGEVLPAAGEQAGVLRAEHPGSEDRSGPGRTCSVGHPANLPAVTSGVRPQM